MTNIAVLCLTALADPSHLVELQSSIVVTMAQFDNAKERIHGALNDAATLKQLWSTLDYNGKPLRFVPRAQCELTMCGLLQAMALCLSLSWSSFV